jgi:hypothetical protein
LRHIAKMIGNKTAYFINDKRIGPEFEDGNFYSSRN